MEPEPLGCLRPDAIQLPEPQDAGRIAVAQLTLHESLALTFALARLEQEEVTELVDRLAAKPEVPVDHLDRSVENQFLQSRLLRHLPSGGFRRRLSGLEMSLGESPVLVGIANKKEAHLTIRATAKDHAAGAGLALGPGLGPAFARTTLTRPARHRPHVWTRNASCSLEHAKRKVLPRIRLNVGEQLAQLNHGQRGFAIE